MTLPARRQPRRYPEDWCHRCELEPATAGGIFCSPCRTIVLAHDVLNGDGGFELIELAEALP